MNLDQKLDYAERLLDWEDERHRHRLRWLGFIAGLLRWGRGKR